MALKVFVQQLCSFARVAVFVSLSASIAGCNSIPDDIFGIDNPQTPASTVEGAKQQTIFIATTREPSDNRAEFYTGSRNDTLGFASVTVSIPPNHETGSVEYAKVLPPDPRNEFVVLEPRVYADGAEFGESIDSALDLRPESDRNILLFVHGYNTKLSAAVLRAAQFAEDSNYQGITVLFSWASRGKTIDYVYDLNSALHARDDLLRAGDALSKTKASGYDVIAHSMGTLLTMEAAVRLQSQGRFNQDSRLRHVVLASPDIDIDVFKKQIAAFPKEDRKFYVLTSSDDRALAFSRRIAGGINRVGAGSSEDLAELGVTVIDLSDVEDKGSLSHSKFADSPEIVQLIGSRINEGQDLDARQTSPQIPIIGGLSATVTSITGGGRIFTVGNTQ